MQGEVGPVAWHWQPPDASKWVGVFGVGLCAVCPFILQEYRNDSAFTQAKTGASSGATDRLVHHKLHCVRTTLSKILNLKGYSTGTDVLDKLCTYFECRVEELIEHVPD